jgi:hypothetical protein
MSSCCQSFVLLYCFYQMYSLACSFNIHNVLDSNFSMFATQSCTIPFKIRRDFYVVWGPADTTGTLPAYMEGENCREWCRNECCSCDRHGSFSDCWRWPRRWGARSWALPFGAGLDQGTESYLAKVWPFSLPQSTPCSWPSGPSWQVMMLQLRSSSVVQGVDVLGPWASNPVMRTWVYKLPFCEHSYWFSQSGYFMCTCFLCNSEHSLCIVPVYREISIHCKLPCLFKWSPNDWSLKSVPISWTHVRAVAKTCYTRTHLSLPTQESCMCWILEELLCRNS